MKIQLNKTLMILVMLAQTIALAMANNYVLVHSDDLAAEDKVSEVVIDFVFNKLKVGESLTVTDGAGKEVARFTIPSDLKYDSRSKRKTKLRKAFADYLSWYDKVKREGSYDLNLPAALEMIAEFDSKDSDTHVLVYGDIVHNKGRHPFIYQGENGKIYWQYPSDAMLLLDDTCRWGTKGREKQFKSLRLHFLYPEASGYDEDYLRYLKKFYSKWIERQGGELHCFTHDKKRAMATWLGSGSHPISYDLDLSCGEPKMVKFEPAQSSGRKAVSAFKILSAENVHAVGCSSSKIVNEVIKSLSANTPKGEISIAFGWDAPVDFDLFVFVDDNAKPLYFANRQNNQGRYLRDKLTSKGIKYEEVVLNKVPSKIEVWANLHRVHKKLNTAPSGEYVLAVDGVAYIGKFNFSVRRGDVGKNMRSRHQSPFWVKIPADCIMKPKSSKVK